MQSGYSTISDGSDSNKKSSLVDKFVLLPIQISLAGVGCFVIFFYVDPGEACAISETCGKWLSDLVGKGIAENVFREGGSGFVFANAYFSFKGVPDFIELLKKQPTTTLKIGTGTFVVGVAAIQLMPIIVNSLVSANALWKSGLSIAGATAGALYGSKESIEKLYYTYSLSKVRTWGAYYRLSNTDNEHHQQIKRFLQYKKDNEQAWKNITNDLPSTIAYITRIKSQGGEINGEKLLDAYVNSIRANRITSETSSIENSNRVEINVNRFFEQATRQISNGAGGVFAAYQLAAFWMPTVRQLMGVGVPEIAAHLIMFLLSIANIYGTVELATGAVNSIVNFFKKLATGQRFDSLEYQLYPKLTTFIVMLALLSQALSYCFANLMFEKSFPGEDVGWHKFHRIMVDVAIVLYHFYAFIKLSNVFLQRSDFMHRKYPGFSTLFEAQGEYNRRQKLTIDQFSSEGKQEVLKPEDIAAERLIESGSQSVAPASPSERKYCFC